MEVVQEAPAQPAQRAPFELPTGEEWAALRAADAERQSRRSAELRTVPSHQKHTLASRMHATVDPEAEESGSQALRRLLQRGSGADADTKGPPPEAAPAPDYVRRKGDNIQDMLVKKRQIFLVQMSLDNKRGEIAKLEQRGRQREEALRASEAALEADAKRFNDFLKENDAKLQAALRRAEAEARARQDKATEAKRLAAQIAHIRSDIGKAEEALVEATRCKAFLDRVTPDEHFAAAAAARAAAKDALRAGWAAACGALAARRADAAAARQRAEHDMQWARTQQQYEAAAAAACKAAAALAAALAEPEPPEPDLGTVDAEEEGLFFEDPAQLLAVFSQLEGRNMLMIQAAQDAEQAVEAARAERAAAEATLGADASTLRAQVAALEGAIRAVQQRCQRLREVEAGAGAGGGVAAGPAAAGDGAAAGSQVPPQLPMAKLTEAYEQAGFSHDASATPLSMLAAIESRLEECVAAVEAGVPPAAAEQIERAREKERRQLAREEKLAAQRAEHEARTQRVLERAAAPAFRRSTKVEMVRSTLQQRRKASSSNKAADDEERELQAFLAIGGDDEGGD
eukprot:scaffold3.g6553.t1